LRLFELCLSYSGRPKSIRKLHLVALSLILFLTFSLVAAAQTTDTATLEGTVTDQNRALAPHIEVTVQNVLTGLRRTASTDDSGAFTLAGLPIAGEYQLTVLRPGFATAHVDHIILAGGSAARVSVVLNVASESTEVRVVGSANDVRIDQPDLGTRLGPAQIEETPLPGRRITYLPCSTPQIARQSIKATFS
jgi:hypothetical protein